jgi:hypothetical protein
LINEVIIPLGKKDFWNTSLPRFDSQFLKYYQTPELQKLLPVLYPGVFPNLLAVTEARADLVAILLTGIPAGIIPGFQNFTGPLQADYLRLNLAIPPNTTNPNRLGLVGGDPAGFPNGRRVLDDVVDIEIKAIAGATLPLVDKNFTTDNAVSLVTQGIPAGNPVQPPNSAPSPRLRTLPRPISWSKVWPLRPHSPLFLQSILERAVSTLCLLRREAYLEGYDSADRDFR